MKTNFTWTKSLFSNLYKIYSNGEPVGNMENKTFSNSAKGSLNGKEFIFKTHGFFKQSTEIIDCYDNKVIGTIEYSNWMTKAEITINSRIINWKYDNFWNTQWSLFDAEGTIMTFNGSSNKGKIETKLDDELLLLSGLFVINYYWQMTFAALIPVFIVIIVN